MERKLLLCGEETGTLFSLISCFRRLVCGTLNADTICLMLRLGLRNLVITFYIPVFKESVFAALFSIGIKKKSTAKGVLLERK